MRYKLVTAALAALICIGCTMRQRTSFRASSPNTVVRPDCLTAPLVLQDCDLSKEPPRCKLVTIKYRASCAQVQLKNPNGLVPR